MNRCGECKHWDAAVSKPGYWDTGKDEAVPIAGQWGTCNMVTRHGLGEVGDHTLDENPEPATAFLNDGSGYFAALICRSDFGCTLWEQAR